MTSEPGLGFWERKKNADDPHSALYSHSIHFPMFPSCPFSATLLLGPVISLALFYHAFRLARDRSLLLTLFPFFYLLALWRLSAWASDSHGDARTLVAWFA